MSRDVVSLPEDTALGYKPDFYKEYKLGKLLGKGGSGLVRVGVRIIDGAHFAVKRIPKVLRDPSASQRKRDAQIPSIKNEVEVLLALRGNLNVVTLESVYEDDEFVYLVMELCHGGELLHGRSGYQRPSIFSEGEVASYLRTILQTVAQCHSRNILHRDVKPENFMHAEADFQMPIKAIDFGLAVFYSTESLPITAPNAEGTPWYLAPEACRGRWWPATDVWACGILAAYMLTGCYPFIDRHSPHMPDLARTLKEICFADLDLSGEEWKGASPEATDFVRSILVKDPEKRLTAIEALEHPFLSEKALKSQRPLHRSVVQRIQRFAQSSAFKRRVLEHIAIDLVQMHFAEESIKSDHSRSVFRERSIRGGQAYMENSSHGRNLLGGSLKSETNKDNSPTNVDPSHHAAIAMASVLRKNAVQKHMHEESACPLPFDPAGSKLDFEDFSCKKDLEDSECYHIPAGVYLPIATPYSRRLAVLLDSIDVDRDGRVAEEQLKQALKKLGYHLNDAEARELFEAIDVQRKGSIACSELSASLIDWKALQDTYKDRWVASVQKVFQQLDTDGDGALNYMDVASTFAGHLDDYEVDAAVHQALVEAFLGENSDGQKTHAVDFAHFLRLLETGYHLEDLRLFDDRLAHPSPNLTSRETKARSIMYFLSCCLVSTANSVDT